MSEIPQREQEPRPPPLGRFDVLAVVTMLIPAYFIIMLVNEYAINVPAWDIWDWSVKRFAFDVGYNLSDLWALTNEHRMFFPQILDLLIANATSLDIIPRIFAKVPFAIAISIVLYFLYRMKGTSSLVYGIAIPISLLTFSLAYWPAWVDPNPLASHISILMLILSLVAITGLRPGWQALGLAAVATLVSSLSYASGMASWIVILGVMYFVGYRERRYFIVWTLLALCVIVPYVIDVYQSTTVIRTVQPAGVLDLGLFVLTFIGAPLAGLNPLIELPASILGLIGLVSFGVLIYGIRVHIKEGTKKMIPWMALIVWVLFNAGAAALGRAGKYGVEGAAVWRYAHIQTLFWIGIIALIAILISEPRLGVRDEKQFNKKVWMDLAAILLTFVIGVGYVNANLYKIQNNRLAHQSNQLAGARECLFQYEIADDDCLRQLYPEPDRIRRYMPRLIEREASFLYDPELKFANATIATQDPRWVLQDRIILDGRSYDVVFQHPPSELTWRLKLLQDSDQITLRTGMIVLQPSRHDKPPSDGVLFRISVTKDGQVHEMLSEMVLPRKDGGGFKLTDVDLSMFAGELIELRLSTDAGPDESYHTNYDWAYWLYPELAFN